MSKDTKKENMNTTKKDEELKEESKLKENAKKSENKEKTKISKSEKKEAKLEKANKKLEKAKASGGEKQYAKIKFVATIIAIILVLGLIAYVTNTIIKKQNFMFKIH